MPDYAIIVAGGKGLRMGGDIPKQFVPVGGEPVLMRTLRLFQGKTIILVLPEAQTDYWRKLCQRYQFRAGHTIVPGGPTRFHSVLNGLSAIPDDTSSTGSVPVVGVHDGVRPFVSREVIARVYEAARESGAAVPVVPVVETLRHVNNGTCPRSEYRIVQTPQAFRLDLLRQAYRQTYTEAFTDDASVVEALGHQIALVEGCRENIKLTTPFDIAVAEAILHSQKA